MDPLKPRAALPATFRPLPLVALLLALTAGCGTPDGNPQDTPARDGQSTAAILGSRGAHAESEPAVIIGADAATVSISASPRIVAMGATVTETLYALGLGGRVIGSDISSLYPDEVLEKPRLGYFRQASAEGIISLNPNIVVSTPEFGPPTVIEQLRSAGVSVLILEDAFTWDDAVKRVELLGRAFGRADRAAQVVSTMQADRAAAVAMRPTGAPRVLFVYARGLGAVYVAGLGTVADFLIEDAGGTNAATNFVDFRQLTPEAIVEAAPDVILVQHSGLESLGGREGLFRLPGIAQTPAARTGAVVTLDGALLVGLGPRAGVGIQQLARKLAAIESRIGIPDESTSTR